MVDVHDGLLDGWKAAHGLRVRPSQWLGDDVVHHPKLDQLLSGDAQRLRGLQQMVRIGFGKFSSILL